MRRTAASVANGRARPKRCADGGVAVAKLTTAYGSVRALLRGDSQYVVPPYQRSYRWSDKKELADLWEDVVMRYEADRASAEESPDTHFLGAIVTGQGAPPSPLGISPFVVIDGQQRIISLSILIAAIRDVLGPDDRARRVVTRDYLMHMDENDELLESKVIPGTKDLATYMTVLRGEPLGRSTHPIAAAYNFFRRSIEAGVVVDSPTRKELEDEETPTSPDADEPTTPAPEDQAEAETDHSPSDGLQGAEPLDWNGLLTAVTQKLELVTISDVTPENAYNVFRTLNSTGLTLDQVDLLRNAFFMLLPKRAAEVHDRLWVPMETRLGDAELGRFFHTNLIRLGENIPYDQTYRTQLQRLKRAGLGEESIIGQLELLEKDSQLYSTVSLAGDGPYYFGGVRLDEQTVAGLRRLRVWGSYPAMPLVLDGAARLRESDITQAQFRRITSWIESLLVRRYLAAIAPNDLRSTFGRVMKYLRISDEPFLESLEAELLKPYVRWPSDDELVRAAMEREFYRQKQKEEFFILRRIAESIEGREYPHIGLGNRAGQYSIEHILPQGELTDAWSAELRVGAETDVFRTWQERKDVIGNLTLTAYNSALSNRPFLEKKDFIENNLRLELSRQILVAEHWTRVEIDDRSRYLGEQAIAVWPRAE